MKPAAAPASLETRLLTVAEISSWLRSARPGETFLYCTGPTVPEGPTKAKVRELTGAGKVVPQLRRHGGVLEHVLVRRPPAAAPAAIAAGTELDAAAVTILDALRRAAVRGRRAYSDQELARIAGLATRHMANWRVRKLEGAGLIGVDTVLGPDGPWRVVTVSGRSTARPERPRP